MPTSSYSWPTTYRDRDRDREEGEGEGRGGEGKGRGGGGEGEGEGKTVGGCVGMAASTCREICTVDVLIIITVPQI